MSDNLKLWDSVEKTDPKNTKAAKIGQLNITAINATSQIKRATEIFGSFGSTWGIRDLDYKYMDIGDTKLAMVGTTFYYPEGSFPIHTSIKVVYTTNGGKGYAKIDDDFMKKAETDLITKSLSRLGFNSDVFMGLYDDNRYVQEMQQEFNQPSVITDKQHQELRQLIQDKKLDYMTVCQNWNMKNLAELQLATLPSFKEWLNNETTT